jgi:cell division protease FtsH
MPEFQEAVERVMAGPERRSRVITEEEKKITAYHEAGHALVAHILPEGDSVHKVSIVARGMMGGYTLILPDDDRHMISRTKFKADLTHLLGGRAAEELVFEDVTTGASSDLERSTRIARKMVTEYGMSEMLGPLTFGQKEELVFLGREIGEQRNYSEEVAQEIDREVRGLIEEAYSRSKEILTNHRERLDKLALTLMEHETLEGDSLKSILEGSTLPA